MTAIMGRMATYSGKELEWKDVIKSDITLCDVDNLKDFNDPAPVQPDSDGNYPIAIPGKKVNLVCDWIRR